VRACQACRASLEDQRRICLFQMSGPRFLGLFPAVCKQNNQASNHSLPRTSLVVGDHSRENPAPITAADSLPAPAPLAFPSLDERRIKYCCGIGAPLLPVSRRRCIRNSIRITQRRPRQLLQRLAGLNGESIARRRQAQQNVSPLARAHRLTVAAMTFESSNGSHGLAPASRVSL